MTSVIGSSRRATASVFDVIYTTANAVDQLIGTGAKGIDMIDAKTTTMHKRVTVNAQAQLPTIEREEILKAAEQHADFLFELDRRLSSDPARKQHFDDALKAIQAAMTA